MFHLFGDMMLNMQRTSSPIPRSRQRAYSSEQFSTGSHGSYEDSVGLGSGGGGIADTSFELMSASQLRDQLRKEQYRRIESQAEVEALKNAAGTLLRVDTTSKHYPLSNIYHTPSNGHDSDSGISHTASGSRPKSPFTHSSSLRSSTSRQLPIRTPAIIPSAEEPWSLSAASRNVKDMHDAMYESEQRRLVLVEKLREAHETLQGQTERLCDSEAKLNDSHYAMENMSTSNQSLQRKLSSLQRDKDDTLAEKMETMRQRQIMETKVEALDRELKNLRLAYTALQSEQSKRDVIVDQTSRALSLVEQENHKFQQTKESMLKEAIALRESLHMSKAKCEKLEVELIDLVPVREDREILVARNSELNAELQDIKQGHSELENKNDLLMGDFRKAREEREVFQNRAIQLEEKCADLNAKCVSSAATKEKLMQEKLDLQQLLNQSNHEREQVNKARQLLDSQITDMQLDVTQSKLAVETKEEEMEKMTEELNAVKKVGEVLSSELSSAKQNLEKLQEEMRQVSADKRTSQQQQSYWHEEATRLTGEKEALNKALEQQKEEFSKERDQLSEQHRTIRENLKEMRTEKAKTQSKCQEIETMLQRANDEIEACSIQHQEEMEEWKSSCDRLTASVGRKEEEVVMLAEQLQQAQDQVTQFKAELQAAQQRHEQMLENQDEMDVLREENKRLSQEHGEDQQVIHLLEMQKNILAKNQTSTQQRQTIDQLQAQVDHLKAELGLAEDKISEAKEELAREQSQSEHYVGMSLSRSARSTPAPCENCQLLRDQCDKLKEMNKIFTDKIKKIETDTFDNQTKAKTISELESKCKDLQTQIQSVNNINSLMTEKVSRLEREKAEVMQTVPAPGEVVMRMQYEQVEREKDRLQGDYVHLKDDYTGLKDDYNNLKATFADLEEIHIQLVTEKANRSPQPTRAEREQLEINIRKSQQENDALQRQIELVRSQSLIAENARMRAEDKIRSMEKELQDLQTQVSNEKQKNRRSSLSPESEASLKVQLDERNQTIQKLQMEIASKNVAMENLRQGVDNRVVEKIRELEDVLQERDDLDEARRKLDQQKLALEIKLEEQRLIIEQLRDERPRLMQEKEAEIDRLDRQKTKLENDLRNTKVEKDAEIDRLGHQKTRLENDLTNMKDQLSEKDGELRRLQMKQETDMDTIQDEASIQIRELKTLTLKKEAEIASLQERIYENEDESREFKNTKNRLDLELEQMQMESTRKMEQLTNIVQRQEEEITGLREEISRKNDLVCTMKQNQDSDVNNLKDMLSETTREFTRFKDSKDREVNDLRSQLSTREEDYEKMMDRKEDQIKMLKLELEDVREERPKFKQSLQGVEEELISVRGELQRVNGMISVKEAQIQEQDRQLQMAEMKHDEAVRDRNEQRRKMQKDLDEREDTITDLQRQMDYVKSEISINQDQAGDTTKRFEERLHSQEAEINTLNKQLREVKSNNRNLTEDNHVQKKEIEKLKISGGGNCIKCKRVKAEKEELAQEKDSLEEEVDDLQQEITRLESLLDVFQQDVKSDIKPIDSKTSITKRTPVKEEIITPVKNRLIESAKPSGRIPSMTSSPSSHHSSRSASPSQHSSTVNPMKLAAAMKRLSLKPSDAQKRASPSPRTSIRNTPTKDVITASDRKQNGRSLSETTPTASANSSRRSSITSLEQADRQRALSPETVGSGSLRQSVKDMPKKAYHEENRTSLNTLEARLKSLQSSSKARKAALDQRDLSTGDSKRKQTRFVLPSSKKFDKASKQKGDDTNHV